MEGLDEYAANHPEVTICRVDGIYHAWRPGADYVSGEQFDGLTARELLRKLAA